MSYIERVVQIQAPPERVWSVLMDVERWPEWTESIRKVEPVDSGPFALGRRYRLSVKGTPPAVWRVTELDEGRSFAWGPAGVMKISAGHALEPADGGTKVTLSITTRGLLAALFARLIVPTSRRNMEMEAEGLKRRSEAPFAGR